MTQRLSYFPNLDSLRAIAALAVIFAHLSTWFVYPESDFYTNLKQVFSFGNNGGRFGVIFFFVLSGFLITYLLFLEQAKTGRIQIIHFYVRRLLRIWPLYFLTVLIGFVVYPAFVHYAGYTQHESANWIMYVCFAANFDHIYNAFPTVGILGVQWSVAVEEQFYLIWPLIFLFFSKSRFFPWLLVAIIICSEIFFLKVAHFQNGGDYHLFNCFRFLSVGGLLAYFCFHHTQIIQVFLSMLKQWVIVLIYFSCLSLMIFQNIVVTHFESYLYLDDIIPVLFFAFVILEQNYSQNSFLKFGKIRFLNWLGKISYGLYLLHMIAIYFVLAVFSNNPDYIALKIVLSLGLTILGSYLSYNYFEKFFLRLKGRFSRI